MQSVSGGTTNHLSGFQAAIDVFSHTGNRPGIPDIVVFIAAGDASQQQFDGGVPVSLCCLLFVS